MRAIARIRSYTDADRGSMIVELVVLLPVIILAIGFLAWAGRQPAADGEIRAAARSAARAASLQRDAGDAVAAGERAGLAAAGLEVCTSVEVSVDVSRWQQGWVSATVTCDVNNQGLIFNGGTLEQSWTEPVQQASRV